MSESIEEILAYYDKAQAEHAGKCRVGIEFCADCQAARKRSVAARSELSALTAAAASARALAIEECIVIAANVWEDCWETARVADATCETEVESRAMGGVDAAGRIEQQIRALSPQRAAGSETT